MREFKPTVMVGVPQIWETVRKGITAKLEAASPLLKNLFWGAYNWKAFASKNKLPLASLFDSIVFGKVRELTGGRMRFTMMAPVVFPMVQRTSFRWSLLPCWLVMASLRP